MIISFTSAKAAPGERLGIEVKVAPAASGSVSVEIERFDPVFGWQFYREVQAFASGGLASVPFTPPAVGTWRAKATYEGSSTDSPERRRLHLPARFLSETGECGGRGAHSPPSHPHEPQ
jgi:hypothetical protein